MQMMQEAPIEDGMIGRTQVVMSIGMMVMDISKTTMTRVNPGTRKTCGTANKV